MTATVSEETSMTDATDTPKPGPEMFRTAAAGLFPIPLEPVSVVEVTPAIAKAWRTERNTHNRPVKKKAVAEYARAMASGLWTFNGASIAFDRNGVLLDGQNRLAGVEESGRSQKFVVVTGLDPESQMTMDQGVPRTSADNLGLLGIKNRTSTAGGVTLAIRAECNDLAGNNMRLRTPEIVSWLRNHPEFQGFADHAASQWKKYTVKPSVLAYTMWRLYSVDPEAAEEFFTRWRESDTGGSSTALGALVARLKVAQLAGPKDYVDQYTLILFIFKAWNAWIAGEGIQRFQATKDKKRIAIPEPLPRSRAAEVTAD